MKQSDDKRRLIIGAPLMLIVVFCFGFFLMHPGGDVSQPAVSDTTTSKKTPSGSSQPVSQPQNLPAAEPAETVPSSSTVSDESTTPKTDNHTTNNSDTSHHSTSNSTTTSSSDNQEGLIQTVFNNLLNGH